LGADASVEVSLCDVVDLVTGYGGRLFDDESEGVEKVAMDWVGNELVGHGTQEHDKACLLGKT